VKSTNTKQNFSRRKQILPIMMMDLRFQ